MILVLLFGIDRHFKKEICTLKAWKLGDDAGNICLWIKKRKLVLLWVAIQSNRLPLSQHGIAVFNWEMRSAQHLLEVSHSTWFSINNNKRWKSFQYVFLYKMLSTSMNLAVKFFLVFCGKTKNYKHIKMGATKENKWNKKEKQNKRVRLHSSLYSLENVV